MMATPILDGINQPADLRRLSPFQLKALAEEIRQELIHNVLNTGGHLASNLGVVELTLALHRVFDSPRDKIIWDVGHQAYVHKLITGRRHAFSSLRQMGGLSGFPDPTESVHDAFAAGHASTSISAAVGMALARDLAGEDYHVVAVIGDGALNGGMAYEALNYAGQRNTRLIVIINDNGMAISPTVGAMARALRRLRLSLLYTRTKDEAKHWLLKFPLGREAWRTAKRARNSFKRFLLPTFIWEELGFTYLGPFDGYNLPLLEEVFTAARSYSRHPVVIHIVTRKGKGYAPAEADAVNFHGVPPPSPSKAIPTYSQVFGHTVLRLLGENPKVVAISAAMLDGTGLILAKKEFPNRVFDVGICEQHAVTMAAGLATQGFIPIVAIYSTFLQRAYDQIIHDVCLQDLPVVFAIDRGGIVGDDGKTHQGAFDISYLGCIPNMVVSAPKDERELQDLLFTAVRSGRPMAIRYPRGSGAGVPLGEELRELPIGKGEVLRYGEDLAFLALGVMVDPALKAASRLEKLGISATVVNARYAKPLDSSLILEVAEQVGRVVTLEENAVLGGFGSAVLDLLASRPQVKVKCLGLPDEFIEHGTQAQLREKYSLDEAGICHYTLESFPELKAQASIKAQL